VHGLHAGTFLERIQPQAGKSGLVAFLFSQLRQRFFEISLCDQIRDQDHQGVIPVVLDVDIEFPIARIPQSFQRHDRVIERVICALLERELERVSCAIDGFGILLEQGRLPGSMPGSIAPSIIRKLKRGTWMNSTFLAGGW
jgi:hypothetical protein